MTRKYFLLLLNISVVVVNSVVLDDIVQSYVQRVLCLFQQDTQGDWFDNVIQPPTWAKMVADGETSPVQQRHFLLPKLFIWAPVEHFQLQLKCPKHGAVMTGQQWTNIINKKSYLNPRMVYDLGSNIILVQRYYRCTYQGFDRQCRYLSGSASIMECLPSYISNLFPFKKYYKSCCTMDIINLVETLVLEGNNFLQISEIIANLNFREFCERNKRFLSYLSLRQISGAQNITDEERIIFYEDLIFSFPSDSQLIRVYLDRFDEKRLSYREEMEKIEATSLSFDHTFKVGKNIGCFRDTDGRYVKQFGFLLLLLNENNEIVDWRLTKSAGYSEVKDLLREVKNRNGVKLKSVHVDNCCQSRKQIQEIMGDVPVKLDLFHAVQRVTNVVPKRTEFSKTFCKEFSLVFRKDGDLGDDRKLKTPEPPIISKNLDTFCERWKTVLDSELVESLSSEIENLRRHITNGCLSGIEPGAGTAGNERIHRSLNRSLLCGTSVIGPELAIAILTVLFHSLNAKRRKEKHFKNYRVIADVPLNKDQSFHARKAKKNEENAFNNSMNSHVTSEAASDAADAADASTMSLEQHNDEMILMADDIKHLLSNVIAKRIVHTSNQLYSVLIKITQTVKDKSANFFDLPFMQIITKNSLVSDNKQEMENSNNNRRNLSRNLASFELTIDPVSGDGDCVFTSFVRQLRKLPEFIENEPSLTEHLAALGLSGGSENDDAYRLRQVFVDQVQSNEMYQMVTGLDPARLNDETELFRERGTFCGNLDDLVVRVCADLLQIPVVVITSLASFPYTSFVPADLIATTPLYLAFDATACGHYDATKKQDSEISVNVGLKGCSCGKNTARGNKSSCLPSARKVCPCVRKGLSCSRKCICKNCCNMNQDASANGDNSSGKMPYRHLSCRCGEGMAKQRGDAKKYAACKDTVMKSKCPCLGHGQGCSSMCSCVGCENVHGARSRPSSRPSGVKRKRSPGIYKRVKGSQFLSSEGISLIHGPWTNYESVLLTSVIRVINLTDVELSPGNISTLYNFVVGSKLSGQMPVSPSSKTATQIAAKLAHMEKKRDVVCARLPIDQPN